MRFEPRSAQLRDQACVPQQMDPMSTKGVLRPLAQVSELAISKRHLGNFLHPPDRSLQKATTIQSSGASVWHLAHLLQLRSIHYARNCCCFFSFLKTPLSIFKVNRQLVLGKVEPTGGFYVEWLV